MTVDGDRQGKPEGHVGHRKQQIRHDRRKGSAITVAVYMLLAMGMTWWNTTGAPSDGQ